MAKKYDLSIDKGSKYERTVSVQDDEGNARDLTGYSARLAIAKSYAVPTPVITLTVGSGITINAALGLVTFLLTDEQTDALTIRSGVYDLKIESVGGVEERILQGGVVLLPQVTT